MNLNFDEIETTRYHSASQIARVKTESWVANNMYCPRCGCLRIKHFENNRPVADFYCPNCNSEFELKSKVGTLDKKINDGAYATMIERITSNANPDFFFMNYSKELQKLIRGLKYHKQRDLAYFQAKFMYEYFLKIFMIEVDFF